MKHNKILAIFLTVIILVSILHAHNFIIRNAHHTCTGENCPICLEMEQALQVISNFKFISILSVIMTILFTVMQSWVPQKVNTFYKETLISLKVELLN